MYHKVGNTGLELGANYQSHKVVAAVKIMSIQYDTREDKAITRLIFDGIPSVELFEADLERKPEPAAGMYLVAYQDGYFSFSPAKQFEEGYTQLDLMEQTQMAKANPAPILQYFAYEHLPPHLQIVSKPLGELARQFDAVIDDGAEKSAGLRKLLEAKDCFVRAKLTLTPR